MDNIVTINNLSHKYGKDWAVKDVSFSIKKNAIVGLLGSNGAGKSTTMNSLCGIIAPMKGEILIEEYDIKSHPIEAKKLLGFLPQHAPLYLDLTVNEYLYHCARLRRVPKAMLKNAVEYAQEYCGVAEYSNRLVGNLSGGYRQRVGIAQAIIHRPSLVVLDEPTNGLDPVQIIEVRNLIRQISENSTVLLSTHVLSEVQAICNEIIMIEKGTMVFNGAMMDFNDLIEPNKLVVGMNQLPEEEIFKDMTGVNKVEKLNENQVKLEVSKGSKVQERIIQLSVDKEWELFELYMEKVSLDSIFAKLSNRKLKV